MLIIILSLESYVLLFSTVAQLYVFLNVVSLIERKTVIGELIGEYLTKKKEMDDHAAHLLFSANRWEFMYVEAL